MVNKKLPYQNLDKSFFQEETGETNQERGSQTVAVCNTLAKLSVSRFAYAMEQVFNCRCFILCFNGVEYSAAPASLIFPAWSRKTKERSFLNVVHMPDGITIPTRD